MNSDKQLNFSTLKFFSHGHNYLAKFIDASACMPSHLPGCLSINLLFQSVAAKL